MGSPRTMRRRRLLPLRVESLLRRNPRRSTNPRLRRRQRLRLLPLRPKHNFVKPNIDKFESPSSDHGLEKDSKVIYTTEDFSSLYNLVGHHDTWEWRDHAYKAFFALFFIRCLQKAVYFGA